MQKAETKQRQFVFLSRLTPGGQQLNTISAKLNVCNSAEMLLTGNCKISRMLDRLSMSQTFNVSDVRQNFNIDFSESSAYVTFSFSTDDFSF